MRCMVGTHFHFSEIESLTLFLGGRKPTRDSQAGHECKKEFRMQDFTTTHFRIESLSTVQTFCEAQMHRASHHGSMNMNVTPSIVKPAGL
jgi:hypothetical protein